jgi:putative transcriptional regulator
MAIAVKLDDLLHDRRMTLTALADRIGMTLANLSILKTGKARAIRFSTLEAICEALSCQPGDILRFEPDGSERESEEELSGATVSARASGRTTATPPCPTVRAAAAPRGR